MKKGFDLNLTFLVSVATLGLIGWGLVGVVIWHFVAKFW